MNISIICPLYNAENYIEKLHESILKQVKVDIESIYYILTESKDSTENLLQNIHANYKKIALQEFSHSLVREKAVVDAKGDIVVFITQDVTIRDTNWLYNLTKDIVENKCDAAFSRQISESSGIEKYIRHKNYSDKSRIVTKKDIPNLGLMTFFFSDASSAISKDIFINLNGYDNKNLIINEDMYLAYKIITNGYRIKYCADSVVVHSHNFTLKQLFKRYYAIGIFFKENVYFEKYNANSSAIDLTKYICSKASKDKNFKVLFEIIPNFVTRFIGMKLGKLYSK